MTSDNWSAEDIELIKRIFDEISQLPPREWSFALDRFFSSDSLVRQAVEKLLLAHWSLVEASSDSSMQEDMGFDREAVEQLLVQHEYGKVLFRKGEVLAERFEMVKLLGCGGMADVYEAQDKELQRRVALKVVRKAVPANVSCSKEFASFRKEVKIAQRVVDRNVCQVFDIGHHVREGSKIIFLTMQLLPGETLSARLKQKGRLDAPEALRIAKQLCGALQAAHNAGVLHRDFKCNNIMLMNSGADVRAVVTDFGIACWTQPEKHLTDPGTSVKAIKNIPGTPAYMSPEQVRGDKLTKASDIYSLGLVLYEMVTGRRPFSQGSDDSTLLERDRRLSEDPVAPLKLVSGLSENWNKAILRCLERDPGKRFPSAEAVIEAIDPPIPPRPPIRWLPRIAATVASIMLVVMIWYQPTVYAFFHPLPKHKNIVIPPCRFAGTNAGDQAIAYGLSKSLIENLSRYSASQSSAWFVPFSEVQGQAQNNQPAIKDAKHPASALGVNLLVTCELGNAGHLSKLNIEVKNAATFEILRSRVIKIPEREVLRLEDQLLAQVADMLDLKIPTEIPYRLPIDQTTDAHAYRLYEQGRGYLAQQHNLGELEKAISTLEETIRVDNNFAIAHADLGDAYFSKYTYTGEPQWLRKTAEASSRSITINDNLAPAPAHLNLGIIFQKQGDLNRAISELTKASILDPGSDETRCHLAITYDKAGLKTEARELLLSALKINPQNWVAEDCLGVLYYRHAQYVDAERYFSKATKTAPGSATAFIHLGAIYLAEGKYTDATNVLTTAIAITPTPSAYSNLGTAQFQSGHYKDAAASYIEATHLDPYDYRLWGNAGDADTLAKNPTRAANDYQQAIHELNESLAMNPKDGATLEYLSLYHAKLGANDFARHILAQAKQKGAPGKDPELLFTSVMIYELVGQRSLALAALRSAVTAGYSRQLIENARELDHLRTDEGYKKIMSSRKPTIRL